MLQDDFYAPINLFLDSFTQVMLTKPTRFFAYQRDLSNQKKNKRRPWFGGCSFLVFPQICVAVVRTKKPSLDIIRGTFLPCYAVECTETEI